MNNFEDIFKNAVDGYEAPFDSTAWDQLSNQLSPMEDAFRNAVDGHEAPYNPSAWSAIKGQIGGTSSVLKWVAGSAAVIGLVAGLFYFVPNENEPHQETPIALNNEAISDVDRHGESDQNQPSDNREQLISNENLAENPANAQESSNNGSNESINDVEPENEVGVDTNRDKEEQPGEEQNDIINEDQSNAPDENGSDIENRTTPIDSEQASNDDAIELDANDYRASIMLSEYELCQGDMVVCSSEQQYEQVIYAWNFGDGTYGSGRSVNHVYQTNGTYTVTLIIRDSKTNRALGSTKETITVNPIPTIDFTWDQQNVVIPSLDFINLSEASANWEWKVNGQLVSDQAQMAYTFREKGTYHINLSATNALGCSNAVKKQVEIDDDYNLLAPTAFSPNGDNLNETFIPSALKIMETVFTMNIYNQNGELIYTTKNISQPWDGSNQNDNSIVQDGAYIWMVTLKNSNGLMETYKGQVMVVR